MSNLKETMLQKEIKKDFDILFKNDAFDKVELMKILKYFLSKIESM